jgi:hypothetical protein
MDENEQRAEDLPVKIDDRHVAWLRAQICGRETSMRQITAR